MTVPNGKYLTWRTANNHLSMTLYCNYGGFTGSQFFVETSGAPGRGVTEKGGAIIVDAALSYGGGGQGGISYPLAADVRTLSTVDLGDLSVAQWHVQTTVAGGNCQHIITSTGAKSTYSIHP